MNIFTYSKKFLTDVFFPKFCLSCEKEGFYICKKCTLFLSEVIPACPACRKHSYFGKIHSRCKNKSHLDGLTSFWEYEGVAKKALTYSKENSIASIPEELLRYGFLSLEKNMSRSSFFTSLLFDEETSLSFIPKEREKLITRDIDHAELTTAHLSKITKKKIHFLFKRIDSLEPQTTEVPKKIILTDDVYKSGKTMEKAAKILKDHGADVVWGFSLTKAP